MENEEQLDEQKQGVDQPVEETAPEVKEEVIQPELEHTDLNEEEPKVQAKVYEPLPMEPIIEAAVREHTDFVRVGPDGQPLKKK